MKQLLLLISLVFLSQNTFAFPDLADWGGRGIQLVNHLAILDPDSQTNETEIEFDCSHAKVDFEWQKINDTKYIAAGTWTPETSVVTDPPQYVESLNSLFVATITGKNKAEIKITNKKFTSTYMIQKDVKGRLFKCR